MAVPHRPPGHRNERGRNEHGRNEHGRNEHGRNEHGRNERGRNEHGRNEHGRHGRLVRHRQLELHRSSRVGWIRASVLGANDGILSTGALLLGMSGAGAARAALLTAGVAGLSAGALSMAIGEYVSVSTQRDTELADRALEERELADDPEAETAELRNIYEMRGLPHDLAQQVAESLMSTDPLGAHLRDELGLSEQMAARPVQAALSSMAAFASGAAVPLLVAVVVTGSLQGWAITAATVTSMVALGALGAALGGAGRLRGALRVGLGGSLALAATYLIGSAVGQVV